MEDVGSARSACRNGIVALQLLLLMQVAARQVAGLKLHVPGAAGDQLVINEGQNLTLWCEDSAEVKLVLPFFRSENVLPVLMYRQNGDMWNGSLVLRDIRPLQTGYYNCSSVANPQVNEGVYVYVRSLTRERPWVLGPWDGKREQKRVPLYSAFIHKTATLECRPNDPSLLVRLRDSKNRTMNLGRQPDGTELSWNPRVGFRFGPLDRRHIGKYWCLADGSSTELEVYLQIVSPELVDPIVQMDDPESNAALVTRGADVNLTCDLATSNRVDFHLKWTTPSGRVNESSSTLAVGVSSYPYAWHQHTQTLHIVGVRNEDDGVYTCTADDGKGNAKYNSFKLNVEGARSGFIDPDGYQTHRTSNHGSSNLSARATLLVSAAFCVLLTPVIRKLHCCS